MTSWGGAGCGDGAVAHGDEVVGVAAGEVEVVDDEDDGALLGGVEVGDEVEDFELVGDVEVGGGFVEEEQVGVLGDGHGQPDALALSTGEFVDGAIGEVSDTRRLEGGVHGGQLPPVG